MPDDLDALSEAALTGIIVIIIVLLPMILLLAYGLSH